MAARVHACVQEHDLPVLWAEECFQRRFRSRLCDAGQGVFDALRRLCHGEAPDPLRGHLSESASFLSSPLRSSCSLALFLRSSFCALIALSLPVPLLFFSSSPSALHLFIICSPSLHSLHARLLLPSCCAGAVRLGCCRGGHRGLPRDNRLQDDAERRPSSNLPPPDPWWRAKRRAGRRATGSGSDEYGQELGARIGSGIGAKELGDAARNGADHRGIAWNRSRARAALCAKSSACSSNVTGPRRTRYARHADLARHARHTRQIRHGIAYCRH